MKLYAVMQLWIRMLNCLISTILTLVENLTYKHIHI
jgi:hypothetical protein